MFVAIVIMDCQKHITRVGLDVYTVVILKQKKIQKKILL